MNNCLVEIKKEFTIHLVNLLNPLIYQGIHSIYNKALQDFEPTVLKTFQDFLSEIKNWNQIMIDEEYNRIKGQMPPYFEALVKATIESNITLLTSCNRNNNDTTPLNVDIKKFIHLVYIEVAREFYNNPILLYHKYTPQEIKKNQREAIDIIKQGIQNAIRKTLPMEDIVTKYLAKLVTLETNHQIDNQTDNKMGSNVMGSNVMGNVMGSNVMGSNGMGNVMGSNGMGNEMINSEKKQTIKDAIKEQLKDPIKTSTPGNLIDIIEKKLHTENNISKPSDISKTLPKHSATSEIDSKLHISTDNHKLDKKLESALKGLGDSELDTGIHYTPENNPKNYQEIYSNNNPTNYFHPIKK